MSNLKAEEEIIRRFIGDSEAEEIFSNTQPLSHLCCRIIERIERIEYRFENGKYPDDD